MRDIEENYSQKALAQPFAQIYSVFLIKVNPNYRSVNVQDSILDGHSVLNYYKKLIKMRKQHEAFIYGKFVPLPESDQRLFCYLRVLDQQKFVVIQNFSDTEIAVTLPAEVHRKTLLLNNYDTVLDTEKLVLRPYEAQVYSC